jgi:hypothetical protein
MDLARRVAKRYRTSLSLFGLASTLVALGERVTALAGGVSIARSNFSSLREPNLRKRPQPGFAPAPSDFHPKHPGPRAAVDVQVQAGNAANGVAAIAQARDFNGA